MPPTWRRLYTARMTTHNTHAAAIITLLVVAAGASAAAPNCTFPDCFRFRVNNCLATPMVFDSCEALGTWVLKPESIPPMGHTIIGIKPRSAFSPTIGNCTWTYNNTDGPWAAFADWNYAPIGGLSTGAGTNDVENHEATQVGSTPNGNQCVWFWYTTTPWDTCYIQSNNTDCTPANDGAMHRTAGRFDVAHRRR